MTSVTDKSSTVFLPNRTGRQSDDAEHNQHVIHQQTIASAPSIDVSSLTSICLAVLVVSNVFFTVLFYCAWKKRQKMWQQQLNRPQNSRQQPSFVDHVASKEEVSKWDLSAKRDPEEESLYDSIQPESMDTYWDIDYVQLRKVVRDKFSTLTTLFKTHSYDVENTVTKLTPKEPDK